MLSENVKWVGSITLEGGRLTADSLVVRRDSVVGARLDRPGVRLSFMAVAVLWLLSLAASLMAFAQTLQFFEPDYTVFAASLLPLLGLGLLGFVLRPRSHLSLLLADGSVLAMASSDKGFLNLCLEAFERLWADEMRSRSSLYLHAGHRSVDFGAPLAQVAVAAPVVSAQASGDRGQGQGELTPMIDLPVFHDEDTAHQDHLDADDVEASEATTENAMPADGEALPQDGRDAADTPILGDVDREAGSEEPDGEWHEDREDEPHGPLIPAADFDAIRPKVKTLCRLLRQRSSSPALGDAVDILERQTLEGCASERQARALARSIAILRSRMAVYPAAITVLDGVFDAGRLSRFAEANPAD